jgi:hypothetical protein
MRTTHGPVPGCGGMIGRGHPAEEVARSSIPRLWRAVQGNHPRVVRPVRQGHDRGPVVQGALLDLVHPVGPVDEANLWVRSARVQAVDEPPGARPAPTVTAQGIPVFVRSVRPGVFVAERPSAGVWSVARVGDGPNPGVRCSYRPPRGNLEQACDRSCGALPQRRVDCGDGDGQASSARRRSAPRRAIPRCHLGSKAGARLSCPESLNRWSRRARAQEVWRSMLRSRPPPKSRLR